MTAPWLNLKPLVKTLPNDSRLFELKGYIERRRPGGSEEEALRNFERAIGLDPRNTFLLRQTAFSYDDLRRYAEEETVLDRALAIEPDNNHWKVARAESGLRLRKPIPGGYIR